MPKRMSCAITTEAVRNRTKTVTRRHEGTWTTLKAGDRLTLIEKGMGLPKGAKQVVLAEVVIVSNMALQRRRHRNRNRTQWSDRHGVLVEGKFVMAGDCTMCEQRPATTTFAFPVCDECAEWLGKLDVELKADEAADPELAALGQRVEALAVRLSAEKRARSGRSAARRSGIEAATIRQGDEQCLRHELCL